MNSKKTMMAAFAAFAAAIAAADVPEITAATMLQSTVSRLVTIEYTLVNAPAVVTLEVQTNANPSASADDPGWTSIGGVGVSNAEGDVWKKVGESGTFNGTITWRPDNSWPGFKIPANGARAIVTAWPLDNTPDYMVVDLTATGGEGTQRYYPGVDFLPGAQLGQTGSITNNQIYKTTTIVMRKIMAKGVTWTMGSTSWETQRVANETPHQVTLTNNYYIGVFEVTQNQWRMIQTSRPTPSYYTDASDRFIHPVEQVCYNEIRNAANSQTADPDYDWPHDPKPGSFLRLLRDKTKIDFDLPSEAQWEFAARAGNGDTKWGDGSLILNSETDSNLDKLGYYSKNKSDKATAVVGSYKPNDWGLYDMAGNVAEWCLDWCDTDITGINGYVNIDPATPANTLSGSTAGAKRMIRGGSWAANANKCRPAFRKDSWEWTSPDGRSGINGFRLVCTAGLQ